MSIAIDIRMFSKPSLVRRVTIDTPGMQDQQQTFPFKLYNMLEYARDSEFSSCISWSDDESAFIIRDKDVMMANLAPMFFNWTKFRSFTRQLNIWGYSRTEIQAGQCDGWRHNKFVRGRPDLLNEIERTQNKSPVKNSFSAAKASALARQRQAKPAAESKSKAAESNKNVVVTAGESCSSSSLSLRLDSQVNQPYNYNETNGHFGIVEAATSSPSQVQALHLQGQGSVFQYLYPNSASLLILGRPPAQPQPAPAQPPAQTFSFRNEIPEQNRLLLRNRSDVDTTTASASTSSSGSSPIPISDRFVPVFDNDELMYLESIFGQDEQDVSHEEELSSILSLDRESKTVEVEGSNSKPM